MTLKAKLTWTSLASIFATIVLAVMVIAQLNQLIGRFDSFRATSVSAKKYTLKINRDLNYVSRLTRSIMLGDDFDKNFSKLEKYIQAIHSHFNSLTSVIEKIPSDKQKLLSAVASSREDTLTFVKDGRERMLQLKSFQHNPAARSAAWNSYKKDASPIANRARSSFKKLEKLLNKSIDDNNKVLQKTINDAHTLGFITGVIVLVVLVLGILSSFIITNIMSRLGRMRKTMSEISVNSDLTKRVEEKGIDELSDTGRIFNSMQQKFQIMIQQVSYTTSQASEALQSLQSTSCKGLKDQQQQNTEITSIVLAMEQMRSSVEEVSQDAHYAAKSASSANDYSQKGIELTQNAVGLMGTLASQTLSTSEAVQHLNLACSKINTVLSVIQSISEQTNLLALNAAIEAARAGEKGRGFAVVADEVRMLANRSQNSTHEIQTIIEQLIARSDDAVAAMNKNQSLADTSVKTIEDISVSMSMVVDEIDKMQLMNQGIAASATEQNQVAIEINNAIIRLQSLSDENQQGAEEVKNSSQELAELVLGLQGNVNQFQYR
ncbi:MAG: methyl-accepting chemotaxis protein [Parashewanella sp.]